MAGAPYRGRAGVRVRPMWPGFAVLALSVVALLTLLVPWNGGTMHDRMPFFWMLEGVMVLASLAARATLARQRAEPREIAAGSEGSRRTASSSRRAHRSARR